MSVLSEVNVMVGQYEAEELAPFFERLEIIGEIRFELLADPNYTENEKERMLQGIEEMKNYVLNDMRNTIMRLKSEHRAKIQEFTEKIIRKPP